MARFYEGVEVLVHLSEGVGSSPALDRFLSALDREERADPMGGLFLRRIRHGSPPGREDKSLSHKKR